MPDHQTVTREEWLKQRLELLDAEKAYTRAGDELARRRRQLPWVKIDKEYCFDTDNGKASLPDLFRRLRSFSSIISCLGRTTRQAARRARQ